MLPQLEHSKSLAYHPQIKPRAVPCTLTILKPKGKQSAGKQYRWDGTTWQLQSGYGKAKYFHCHLREIGDIGEWHTLLQKIATHNVFLVMGLPKENNNLERMTRRSRPRPFVDNNGEHRIEPPTLADRPGYLLPFDFDSIACPAGLNVIQEPEQAIRWLIETTLPMEFHKAGVVYQFSSSFGLTNEKLKVHLFFWLSVPVTMATAKEWAKSYNNSRGYVPGNNATKTVDDSVYQPQQPIYTKIRACHGADDPVPAMIGILPGSRVDFETVCILQKQQDDVDRAERQKNAKVEYSGTSGQGVTYRISRIGVDGHHEPIRNAAAAIVATEGRAAVETDLIGHVALLRDHVAMADRLGKPEAEFQRIYLADSYFRQQFQSALDAGFGDNASNSSRAEQQTKAIKQFKHSNWLVKPCFPGKTFDLSGDL